MADTKTIRIAGVEFQAPVPYAEGHVLNAVEAKALNQTFHENLRNNFAPRVKASAEGAEGALTADQLPDAFAKYASEYTFSTPSAGGTSRALDPVEREARALARELVKNALAKQDKKLTAPKDASDEEKATYKAKIEAKIVEISERDEVVAQAKKNVESRGKAIDKISADLAL